MKRSVALFALATATIVGCGESSLAPPVAYPFSRAVRSCGPTDGPAFVVMLSRHPIATSPPKAPFIHISIYTSAEDAVGKSIALGPNSMEGYLSYKASDDLSTSAVGTGTINVTSVESPDGIIEGSVNLMFPSQKRIHGVFSTTILAMPVYAFCG